MVSKKSNHAREYNGHVFPDIHETWAARVLNMTRNPGNGIDLIRGKEIGVEIKFILEDGSSRTWTTQDHQLAYADNGRSCYWGFGTYLLDRPVCKINTKDLDEVERMIVKRELYLIGWDWVRHFPVSHTNGQTAISNWALDFRYPKMSEMPKTSCSYEVEKGEIHLTTGVRKRTFEKGILDSKRVPFYKFDM